MHSDVLKIGHHGSKNSTMTEFLAAVRAAPSASYQWAKTTLMDIPARSFSSVWRMRECASSGPIETGAVHVLTDGHAAGNHLLRCLPSYDKKRQC